MTFRWALIVVVSRADSPTSVGAVVAHGADEPLHRHVDAEVVDLEAVGREHGCDERLADLVDVAAAPCR